MPDLRGRRWPFDFEIHISGLFAGEPFSLHLSPEDFVAKNLWRRAARERNPYVELIEENGYIRVLAELPGVGKEDIDLRATETSLIISAESPERRYYKEVRLPSRVDPKSAKAAYKNGVLEVSLSKADGRDKGEKISIE
jgi:HSP20 family molecular chaperone IbpA